jgi:hypothetical protein
MSTAATTPVPARRRIVVLEVDFGPQSDWVYGSGLLIGSRGVLTAAHVVSGARAIRVHRAGEAEVWDADPESMLIGSSDTFDVAVLDVDGAELLGDVPIALVNREVEDGRFIEECWAVGYPIFASDQRPGVQGWTRESIQVGGRIAPLSDLGTQLLSLEVTARPDRMDDAAWRGMSGAAVYARDRLLGVVTEYAPHRGVSNLTVTAFDALLSRDFCPPHPAKWWRTLGVDDPDKLPLLPQPEAAAAAAPPAAPTEPLTPTPPLAGPEAAAGEPVTLENVIDGTWIIDIRNPMAGQQTMRVQMQRNGPRAGMFQAVGIYGLPGWQAGGQFEILPDNRAALTGVQQSPANFPPRWPLQEQFSFRSVTRDQLEGENGARMSVTWRRDPAA